MSIADSSAYTSPGVVGSGTVGCGLAATVTTIGEIRMLCRSEASAERAAKRIAKLCERIEGSDPARVKITTDPADLAACDLIVESVVEDFDIKVEVIGRIAEAVPGADLASTTSSLSIGELAEATGQGARLFGLHVFNPVPRMALVELCLPAGLEGGAGQGAVPWCEALGKTPVPVPDRAGFVVNRLLFPYLFDAVRFQEESGMTAADVDACMQLGAGHPMGPLRLLDFVGLDVAVAIGENLHAVSGDNNHLAPAALTALVAEGKLGRKTGAGFYDDYS